MSEWVDITTPEECDRREPDLQFFRFGVDPRQWEEPTVDVCIDCLRIAMKAMEEER